MPHPSQQARVATAATTRYPITIASMVMLLLVMGCWMLPLVTSIALLLPVSSLGMHIPGRRCKAAREAIALQGMALYRE